MKKIFFCIISILCIVAFAAGAETPFLEFSFSHDATETAVKGDVINCTVSYKNIDPVGLSSIELLVSYSDGLVFNNDCASSELDENWAVWQPNVSKNSVKIGIVDESAVTPGTSDIILTFSFTVTSESFTGEFIRLSKNYVYDFNINEVNNISSDVKNASFAANVPEVKLENKGASLRINNTPALRFGAELVEIPRDAKYGILVSESDELEGELTHSSLSATDLELNNKISDSLYSTAAFAISSNVEKYTFRPYAILKMSDGSDYFVYFEAFERCAQDIARAELEAIPDSANKALLESFLTNT